MSTPLEDFGRVLKHLFRFMRYASYTLIGFMLVFLAFRVAEIYAFFADMHAWAGIAFLVVFFTLFWWLIGRPAYRFLKMPVAIRPPTLPPRGERRPKDVVRHLTFVERYVGNLLKNPEWEGSPDQVEAAVLRCRALKAKAQAGTAADMDAFSDELRTFEKETVGRLLEPLDRKASETIRREAMGVGVATAVSWNGTIDAFIVLWRNCNLVARVAGIYYGRPGTRGTLSILRDVSAATLASMYLEDLTEVAGSAIGGIFGKTMGVVAAPVMEGGLNAVATLRIGYVAKARCRAFERWNERTTGEAVAEALREAGLFTKEVVTGVVKTVGGGLMRIPGQVIGKVGGALGSIWKKLGDDPAPEPSGA
ncbi:MAG: YcjF family protein [Planctomycetota bacterium]|nr:YcjF family protein [Planctomycetota bacterium]